MDCEFSTLSTFTDIDNESHNLVQHILRQCRRGLGTFVKQRERAGRLRSVEREEENF